MPVFKYLDVSTGHLSDWEQENLPSIETSKAYEDAFSIRVIPHEFGWWVNVPSTEEELEEAIKSLLTGGGRFGNVALMLKYAFKKECFWINFDSDAIYDVEPGQETYIDFAAYDNKLDAECIDSEDRNAGQD
jgi:hypothetical protein